MSLRRVKTKTRLCVMEFMSVCHNYQTAEKQYANSYRSASLVSNSHRSGTLTGHLSGPDECRDSKRTEPCNPRHSYADPSHPFSIVLPVRNRMDDLEVALQGDDHQTDISRVHTKAQLTGM